MQTNFLDTNKNRLSPACLSFYYIKVYISLYTGFAFFRERRGGVFIHLRRVIENYTFLYQKYKNPVVE